MALTPQQTKQLRKFVTTNYKPALRRGALKKFTLKAQKDGLGFITSATARGKAKGAGQAAAPPPPGPYDRYKALGPGAVGTLTQMDRMRDFHLGDAAKAQDWFKNTITPMQGAGADASKYYAQLGAEAAKMGALPNMMPLGAAPGGGLLSPGAAGADINAAGIAGQGAAAAGTQAASYQGFMQEQAGRDLGMGLAASLAQGVANLGGQYNQAKLEYMQQLDQNLFELEQASAERESEMALEEMKLANDRYTARLGLVSDLTGIQGRQNVAAMNNDADLQQNRETTASRERIAASNNASRQSIAAANNRLKALKIAADRAKGTGKQKDTQTKLVRQVQKEFDALWTGEAPDPLVPGSGHGWRYTARSRDKATREKAAYQVLGWLAATGLVPAHVHRLFRSKGFSDAEFQRAARRVESGGGF